MRAWLLVVSIGCGGAPSAPNKPVEPAPAPAPEPAPEPEPAVGAMPVPPEEPSENPDADWYEHPPIEALDTTVTEAMLPRADVRWKKRVEVERSGQVMIVLRVDRWTDGGIYLSIVEDQTGIQEQWKLGSSDDTVDNPIDGTAFHPARAWDAPPGDGILFAARIRPRGSRDPHQFVVYSRGTSVLVVERELGATVWKRPLRLEFEQGTTFLPIGTSDPH